MVHTQAQPPTVNGGATVSRICEAPNKSISAVSFKYLHLSAILLYRHPTSSHSKSSAAGSPTLSRYLGTVMTPKHERDHKAANTARLHICALIKLPSTSTTTPTLCVANTQKRRPCIQRLVPSMHDMPLLSTSPVPPQSICSACPASSGCFKAHRL
jgi:hypothetical protein